jgi:hypothetical protein
MFIFHSKKTGGEPPVKGGFQMQLLCGLVVVGKVAVKNINNAFESFFGKEFHSPTLDVWLDFVLVNQSAEQIRIVFVPSAKLRNTHVAFGFYHFSHSFQSFVSPQPSL